LIPRDAGLVPYFRRGGVWTPSRVLRGIGRGDGVIPMCVPISNLAVTGAMPPVLLGGAHIGITEFCKRLLLSYIKRCETRPMVSKFSCRPIIGKRGQ
jgi:hypothetical protein